jgi:hypothetical protein
MSSHSDEKQVGVHDAITAAPDAVHVAAGHGETKKFEGAAEKTVANVSIPSYMFLHRGGCSCPPRKKRRKRRKKKKKKIRIVD